MTTPTSLRLLLGIAALSASSSFAFAADGAWSTTDSGNWSDDTKWFEGNIADGAGSTATFAAPLPSTKSPVVTIALDSDRTIGNLYFYGPHDETVGTHNFTLNGPGILTLSGGTPTISAALASSRTATVNVTLDGTEGVTFSTSEPASPLVIGGANTYTGLTQISGFGFITVANTLAFGSTDGETTITTTSAAIRLNNGITVSGETLNIKGNGTSSNYGALHTADNAVAEWAGDIRLDGATRFGAGGASAELKLSGVISDGAATGSTVTFSGANNDTGTVTLSGANTYTGATDILRGTVKLDAGNNRLPTGTTVTIGGTTGAATLDLNGYDQTVAGLLNGTNTGTRTLTNTGVTTSTFTVNQTSGTAAFDGIVSGAIDFVKSGGGTLNLTGTANTFTGNITVNGGTFGIASAFISDTADVFIASGAIFALNFSGTDTISGLYLAGIAQELGTYGAVGSGAQFESAFFTGTGLLNVTAYAIPEPSSVALLAGALTLGVVTLRRRRR